MDAELGALLEVEPRSEPHFAKRELMKAGSHQLFNYYPPRDTWVDNPVVFADKRSATRALQRIARRAWCKLAVVTALALLGCGSAPEVSSAGGASKAPDSGTVRTEAGANADPGREPAALVGAGASAGGSTMDQPVGGTAGAGGTESTPVRGGAAGSGGAGGSQSVAGGAAAGAPSGGGGGAAACLPRAWDAACAGLSCGDVPDGCGGELHCGGCQAGTECVAGSCRQTCATAGLECGDHPALGLSCGDCPSGQECGSVSVGHCSTCAEINQIGVCPVARPHLWAACGSAPAAECRKPYDQDPSWWCCP